MGSSTGGLSRKVGCRDGKWFTCQSRTTYPWEPPKASNGEGIFLQTSSMPLSMPTAKSEPSCHNKWEGFHTKKPWNSNQNQKTDLSRGSSDSPPNIFFLIFSARFSTTEKGIPSQIDLHHCRKSLPPLGYPAMGWKAKDHAGSSALSTWNSMHWQRENTTCRDDPICRVKLTIWW